jgi:hypothetical protein
VIDPRLIFIATILPLVGGITYIRATLRGETAPNRVTWTLWGIEPLLAFIVERQQHVGLASVMSLVLGVIPIAVVAASFKDPNAVWSLGRFDFACGLVSIVGLIVWITANQPTVGLISFVLADAVAALPTVRKAYRSPESETAASFLAGALYSAITLMTLTKWTTAGGLFPLSILLMNTFITFLIVSQVGIRAKAPQHAA